MPDLRTSEAPAPPALSPPGPAWIHPVTRWLDGWALSPVALVVGTFTIAVAGLLGSLWGPEIRSALPITWRTTVAGDLVWIPSCIVGVEVGCDVVGQAVLFWFMALAGSLVFGWREWARGRNDASVQAFLIGQTRGVGEEIRNRTRDLASQAIDLHERARTLPPEQFMQHARAIHASMHEMLRASLLAAGNESASTLLRSL